MNYLLRRGRTFSRRVSDYCRANMDFGLNNKRALVTGASRGLGKAIAAALSGEGAKVAICARDAMRREAAAKETGAIGFAADLSQAGAVDGCCGTRLNARRDRHPRGQYRRATGRRFRGDFRRGVAKGI